METKFGVCPICNGTGLKITNKEFSMEECECIQIEKIRNHVKELKASKFLTSTPLLHYLNEGRDIIIESDDFEAVRCHLKTALVLNRGFKSFKIVNPGHLVALSIENPTLIENIDLLVIECSVFPHYDNAAKRHEFTMATRNSLGKPTWFVIKGNFPAFKCVKNNIYTPGFLDVLNKYAVVRISREKTNSLIKSPNVKDEIKTNRGAGIMGVTSRLLDFNPEIDKRLHDIKE